MIKKQTVALAKNNLPLQSQKFFPVGSASRKFVFLVAVNNI
jgi:hypothetical protein